MFGFGSSTVATLAVIIGAPAVMCLLLYVLVRLEPPTRRSVRLVGLAPSGVEAREASDSAA